MEGHLGALAHRPQEEERHRHHQVGVAVAALLGEVDDLLDVERPRLAPINSLENIIKDRKGNPKEGSYTTSLLQSGINKISQKVGEEAIELIIEAKDNNENLFLNEAADLLYHYLVLLTAKNVSLKEVEAVLKSRHAG
jgi:phosphoribosyl-ATP pyrophosphohydrolase/phosphoribosyl-AMP cyclohydrolase